MDSIKDNAQKIIDCCGHQNIERVYCCITRLRLLFYNKEVVDFEKLENHPMVQGIVWSDDECQLIIGLQVMALNDTISLLLRKQA